jgi:MATE family multidrug resistance protein
MRSPSTFLSEIRTALQLAIPLAGIQLSEAAISFVNTVMMGFLGIESFAAGALGVITFYTVTFICMGIVEGASPLAAEAFGAGKVDRIRQLFAQGLWLVLILSLPMMLLVWHLDSILMLLGQQEQTVTLTSTYLKTIVWGFPAAVGFYIIKEVSTALNRPQPISVIALASIPINIIANYVLLFGHLGFPPLGLAGIGWAGTFVFWVNFLAAAGILSFHPGFREYKLFSALGFDKQVFAELWHNGWPVGLQYGSSLLVFTLIALLSGYMGTTVLAANEIVVQSLELSLIIPVGIAYAAMTQVGQRMGQDDPASAKIAGLATIVIGITATTAIVVAVWMFPEKIVSIYLDISNPDNAEALEIAIPLLKVVAVFLIAYGLNLIAMAMLQGIQDLNIPLLVNIFIQWFVGMGGGYLLCFNIHWGGVGLWLGLTIGTALATVFLICRFYFSISNLNQSSQEEERLGIS